MYYEYIIGTVNIKKQKNKKKTKPIDFKEFSDVFIGLCYT